MRAIQAGLKLVDCPIRHLGTEMAQELYGKLEQHLTDNGVEIIFKTECVDLICLLYTSFTFAGSAAGYVSPLNADFVCQMLSAYSCIALSAEKMPAPEMQPHLAGKKSKKHVP